MPQNSNFRLPCGHRFFPKNGSYGYGAKSRWEPLGSISGPVGSHWVKKNGSKPLKITMPQNSTFQLPRGHPFFPKNGSYGYGAKSWWGHHRVHLGANGVPLGPKNWSKPLKITLPQNSNFRLSAVINFSKKWKLRLWRQITVENP